VVAFDGASALDVFDTHRPLDLILMDRGLTGMEGEAATRRIREREHSSGGHVPIIGVSASVGDEARAACLDAGMDDFISKPTSLESLGACLARWLPEEIGFVFDVRVDAESTIDSKTMADVRRLYDASFLRRVSEISAAIQRGAAVEVADAAHTLRGPSLLAHEQGVAEICRQIEDQARKGSLEGTTGLALLLPGART